MKMSTPHHGQSSQFSEELRQQLIASGELKEAEIRKRFMDQVSGQEKRNYSQGRIGPDDDGDLTYVVRPDAEHEIVRLDFGKPVEWIGLPPQQAIELAQSLIRNARAISTEPLRIQLH